MDFAFEVRETDLLGRIGRLRVNGKTLETPYLFPVIHPVNQLVTTRELESMGFRGLMTNSYIIRSRRKDDALAKGIHRLLDFEGVFMTDSGGYQVLEYGDLDVGYRDIATLQQGMGSELSVTLDRPTGLSKSAERARSTVEYSLKNAKATLREFGKDKTVWVGPVQGGLFPELIRRSASALVRAGFDFLALGSPVQVMQNYRFRELSMMISVVRRAIPYSMPLHLFGAGHPLTMALAVALGCDTFDSASYVLFAREGRYMTERGATKLETMKYLPCSCSVCSRTTAEEMLELDPKERVHSLSLHNLNVLRKEIETCKEAIVEGRLWDLVHERAMAHPSLFAALGTFTAPSLPLADGTAPLMERGLFVRDGRDLSRPELSMAAARITSSYRRRFDTAVLKLPEGAVSRKADARTLRKPEKADHFKLHPLLGPYPLELEFTYPFSQTVVSPGLVPSWDQRRARAALRKMGYTRVVLAVDQPVRRAREGLKSRPK